MRAGSGLEDGLMLNEGAWRNIAEDFFKRVLSRGRSSNPSRPQSIQIGDAETNCGVGVAKST